MGGAPASLQADAGTEGPLICDESEGLRFAAAVAWNGPVGYATGVLFELGVAYILVNGHCEYVTWNHEKVFSPVRHGVLDDATAKELAVDFGYSGWAEKQTYHGPDSGGGPDSSSLVLFDGEHPVFSGAVNPHFEGWIKRLYDAGEDLSGSMRLRVFESPYDPVPGEGPLGDWPLSTPAADLLSTDTYSGTKIWGPAHLIDNPDDTARLRALRPGLKGNLNAVKAKHPDPTKTYSYAFRDVTPFENGDGQIPGFLHVQ